MSTCLIKLTIKSWRYGRLATLNNVYTDIILISDGLKSIHRHQIDFKILQKHAKIEY